MVSPLRPLWRRSCSRMNIEIIRRSRFLKMEHSHTCRHHLGVPLLSVPRFHSSGIAISIVKSGMRTSSSKHVNTKDPFSSIIRISRSSQISISIILIITSLSKTIFLPFSLSSIRREDLSSSLAMMRTQENSIFQKKKKSSSEMEKWYTFLVWRRWSSEKKKSTTAKKNSHFQKYLSKFPEIISFRMHILLIQSEDSSLCKMISSSPSLSHIRVLGVDRK